MELYNQFKELIINSSDREVLGYPPQNSQPPIKVFRSLLSTRRVCSRCSIIYEVNTNGYPVKPKPCLYHPYGKITINGYKMYRCCKTNNDGCNTYPLHVCAEPDIFYYTEFVATQPSTLIKDPRDYNIYALNCKLLFTTRGMEVCRINMVDNTLKPIFESLIKPNNQIVDYNTHFTGVNKIVMKDATMSLRDAQKEIQKLCTSKTILCGHGFHNDLHALQMLHENVIDTAAIYRHRKDLPYVRDLHDLAKQYLGKTQCNHFEDSSICMELVLNKMEEYP